VEEEILTYKPSLKIQTKRKSVIEALQTHKTPDLSVIIPAYNEEKTIGSIIKTIKKIVLAIGISHEIIVINDGSTDRTKEEAENTGANVINLKKNTGKANALIRGFEASKGKYVLTLDADGSHQENDIKKLIEEFFKKKVHMLIGSRFLNKIEVRFTSPTNIVGNKLFKYILLFISGKYITDSQSGLRIFSRTVLKSINCMSRGYEIESKITAETLGMGFKIGEIPINCKPRLYGSSCIKSWLDGTKITKTIIQSYFRGRRCLKENNRK